MSEPKINLYDIKDFKRSIIKYAKDGDIYIMFNDGSGFVLEKSDDFIRKFSVNNYMNVFRNLSINDKGNVRL